jgi:glyceraldehyde 3-phosphate dehydrogenase
MINIGLNGFGRIGRALARMIMQSKDCRLVVVNELDPDIKNLTYLLKYDSIYGRFTDKVDFDEHEKVLIHKKSRIKLYSFSKIDQVPWASHKIDVLIDATGVKENAINIKRLVKRGVPKVLITHSPPEKDVDITIILGINENSYNHKNHDIISTSICDASAVGPVLHEINAKWGIRSCFVTTLHPWLNYQNLLDGPLSSVSSPGHFWKDYSLGRNSTLNLISKDTTAASAILKVMPELAGKIDAVSFRVPTNIVSASDLTICLKKNVSSEKVNDLFIRLSQKNDNIFDIQSDNLVSMDYLGTKKSAIIDAKRTKVIDGKMLKMIIWYDNEWGYSSKVLDIARLVSKKR